MSSAQLIVDLVRPSKAADGLPEGAKPRTRVVMPPYALSVIQGQMPRTTPDGRTIVVRAWDEGASGPYLPAEHRPDQLWLSYLTSDANRAHDLSLEARETTGASGWPIRVVHGGVHPTNLPREAMEHGANVVVRGELTPEFQSFLVSEAESGTQAAWRLDQAPHALSRGTPDWSWVRRHRYLLKQTIQTSVGCPFHCSFCSTTEVYGAKMRSVGYEQLEREFSVLKRGSTIAFIDDNFLQGVGPSYVAHTLRVAQLCDRYGLSWVVEATARTVIQAQATMAKILDWPELPAGVAAELRGTPEPNLLEYWARHGLTGIFIGVESINDDSDLKKSMPKGELIDLVRHCHGLGVAVLTAFVLGVSPTEDADYHKRVAEFAIEQLDADLIQVSIDTPMPGSRSFLERFESGSIVDFNWDRYDAEHCVVEHPKLRPEQLEEAHRRLYAEFYRLRNVLGRYPLKQMLEFRPNLWRRVKMYLPINLVLHQYNRAWERRTARAVAPSPRPLSAGALADIRERVGASLFDIRNPSDGISRLYPLPGFAH